MTDILRLQARVRSDDAANLFVRLSPPTVVYLRDRARLSLAEEEEDGHPHVGSSTQWSLLATNDSEQNGRPSYSRSGVEFLPLLITNVQSNVTVYASYNGGEISSGEASGRYATIFLRSASRRLEVNDRIRYVVTTTEPEC